MTRWDGATAYQLSGISKMQQSKFEGLSRRLFGIKGLGRILLCLSFCLLLGSVVACDDTGVWTKSKKDCDVLQFPVIKNARLYRETFAKEGAIGCLRVTWGQPALGGLGIMVRLTQDGSLVHFPSSAENTSERGIRFQTPSQAQGQEYDFTLFIMGRAFQSDPGQKALCEDQMKDSDYTCELDEGGECWFSLRFQVESSTSGRIGMPVAGLCQLKVPKTDSQVEPNPSEPTSLPESTDANVPKDGNAAEERPSPEERTGETGVILDQVSDSGEQIGETSHQEQTSERAADQGGSQGVGKITLSSWVKRAGSSGSFDHGYGLAVDSKGNILVTGIFDGTVTFGSTQLVGRSREIFVAKMDSDGHWLWARRAGSAGYDYGFDVVVDSKDNVILTGYYNGLADFGKTTLPARYFEIYIAKLDSSGKWLWAKRAGTNGKPDIGYQLAVDKQDNIILVGSFQGSAQFGPLTVIGTGKGNEAFVAKLDSAGKWLWVSHSRSSGADIAYDVKINQSGEIIVCGSFTGTIVLGSVNFTAPGAKTGFFIPRSGLGVIPRGLPRTLSHRRSTVLPSFFKSALNTSGLAPRMFIAALDTGGKWKWVKGGTSKYFGASAKSLALDGQGGVVVIGKFLGELNVGTSKLQALGDYDFFIARLDKSGKWSWAHGGGGTKTDNALDIAIDSSENIWVVGTFQIEAYFGANTLTAKGDKDIFVTKLDKNGKWLNLNYRAGGTKYDHGEEIAIDAKDNIIVTGTFRDTATFGQHTAKSNNFQNDIFIWKFR